MSHPFRIQAALVEEIGGRSYTYEPLSRIIPMTPIPEAPTVPLLPYSVRSYPYGTGVERLTKVYPDRIGGDLLTPEELAVWSRLCWSEAEVKRLTEENAALRADLDAATAPTEVKKGEKR